MSWVKPRYVKISSALGFKGYSEKSNNDLLNPCVFLNKNKATAKTESNNGDLPYGTSSFCLWSRATVITWSARREGNWSSSSVSYEDNDSLPSERWAKAKQLVLQSDVRDISGNWLTIFKVFSFLWAYTKFNVF